MKIHNALPCLFGLGLAVAVSAPANAADLAVRGSIAPQSCTLNIVDGGDLSLGDIDVHTLSESGSTQLSKKIVSAEVNCDYNTKFGFSFADQVDSSTNNSEFYLVSNDEDATRLGWYEAAVRNASMDGVGAVAWRVTKSGQYIDKKSTVSSRDEGHLMIIRNSKTDIAKAARFDLEITPHLVAASEFDKANFTSLRGGMTVELEYR